MRALVIATALAAVAFCAPAAHAAEPAAVARAPLAKVDTAAFPVATDVRVGGSTVLVAKGQLFLP